MRRSPRTGRRASSTTSTWSSCAASPRGEAEGVGLYHASPRDPIWEYVLSSMLADLCLTAQPERISAVGHSHVALSFSRDQEAEASGTPREIGEIADRRAASGSSTPAASVSPATAIRAPRGSCSTPRRGPPSGGASSTTSKAPRRRSGPRACRIARGSPGVRSMRRSAVLLVTAFAVGLLAAFAASCAGNGDGRPCRNRAPTTAQARSPTWRSSSTAATATASTDSCAVTRPRMSDRPARVDRRGARASAAPGAEQLQATAITGATTHRDDAADPDRRRCLRRRSRRRSRP